MTSLQKATIWFISILVFVFALSIGLSWYTYGYFDLPTVGSMALMLVPLLVTSVAILVRSEHPAEDKDKARHKAPPARLDVNHAASRSA